MHVSLSRAGLSKKELVKALTHSQSIVQMCGLRLVHAVTQRMSKLLAESGVNRLCFPDDMLCTVLARALPDFSALANLRAK